MSSWRVLACTLRSICQSAQIFMALAITALACVCKHHTWYMLLGLSLLSIARPTNGSRQRIDRPITHRRRILHMAALNDVSDAIPIWGLMTAVIKRTVALSALARSEFKQRRLGTANRSRVDIRVNFGQGRWRSRPCKIFLLMYRARQKK